MPSVHSALSPSSASRWLSCPGSLLIEGQDKPSEYAAQGTVAHALASKCWLLGCDPDLFIGQPRSCDGYTVVIDQEMVEGVRVYLGLLESIEPRLLVEQRIEHSEIEGFGGTVDCVVPTENRIIDFKYGAGVAVDPENNEQLGCYAILAMDKFGFDNACDFELTIVQPRAFDDRGPVRTWVAERDWLMDLKERIAYAAANPNDKLNAGDHCRWCPHKAQCPELYEMTLLTAKQEFKAPDMDAELATKVLGKRYAIESYLEAVEQWVHGQLEKGVDIPGYKLVNKYGNRRYAVDEATVERQCKSKGFGKKQIYETSLLSPAQLEKVVGKELVTSLVERPHTGTTVVPESDKREAVKRLAASDEFANERLEELETVR